MFERILKQIREKIRRRQYVMTLHAEEEMSDDDLSIFDVERSSLRVMRRPLSRQSPKSAVEKMSKTVYLCCRNRQERT